MTKTNEVNEMLVTGLEIILHNLRTEMDEITFRRNNLNVRARELSAEIESTKARLTSLTTTQENSK